MTFIYDIILNFTDNNYYDIYEWKKDDYLLNIKKAPIFRVDKKFIYDLINKDIKVDNKFLSIIKDKNIISKKDKYSYICLFSDCEKSIGVAFNNKGYIIFRSSLLIDEEIESLNIVKNIDIINIKYSILRCSNNNYLREDNLKIKYIISNIKSSYKKKEYDKLKYLYFDIFGTCEKNNLKIFNKLINIKKYYYLIDNVYNFFKSGNKIIEK